MTQQPRAETWKRGGQVIVLLALAAAVLPAPSPAAATNTVEGTCTLSGRLTFDEPFGNELRETGFRDYATGTCTGTLNGVSQMDAPVVIRSSGSGVLSCLAGRVASTGTLTFTRGTKDDRDDARIRYATETTGALLEFVSTPRGIVSGQGIAHVNFLPYADEEAFAACEAGTFGTARYDLLVRTITPIVG
jgi:hypothetical protein